jgi:hypothetical protein
MKILGKRVKHSSSYAESHTPNCPVNDELKLGTVHHALCLKDESPPSVTCERDNLADDHRNPTGKDIVDSEVLNEDVQQYVCGTGPDAAGDRELDCLGSKRIPELLNPAT